MWSLIKDAEYIGSSAPAMTGTDPTHWLWRHWATHLRIAEVQGVAEAQRKAMERSKASHRRR